MTSVAFCADGRRLCARLVNGVLVVWNLQTGVRELMVRPAEAIERYGQEVRFTPHGIHLVSAWPSRGMCLWDSRTGKEVLRCESQGEDLGSIAISVDGKLGAAQGFDMSLHLWDLRTGKRLRRWVIEEQGGVRRLDEDTVAPPAVAIAPVGTLLASGSRERAVYLWNVPDCTRQAKLTGHAGRIRRIEFSRDGSLLASAASEYGFHGERIDCSIRVWDVKRANAILVIPAPSDSFNALSFSPDDRFLVSGGGDGSLGVWEVASPTSAVGPSFRLFSAHLSTQVVAPLCALRLRADVVPTYPLATAERGCP